MDYDQMAIRELQEECRRRGLPSGRAKAELVRRLAAADAQQGDDFENDFAASEPVPVVPAEVLALVEDPAPAAPLPPAAFRKDFPTEPGGPDEETHLAYRQATLHAAAEAGWQTRGDAHRTGTVDGRWVYEVSVRRGP